MKEWVCEEVPAVTLDNECVSTFMHQIQELVRCKDCKYRIKEEDEEYGDCLIRIGYFPVRDDFFCADGKSREQTK